MNKNIGLGYPLDLLLNREINLNAYQDLMYLDKEFEKDNLEMIKGIQSPNDNNPGTGNIVIIGRPGTGKSTLALQMAVSCILEGNKHLSAFFSIEESVERLLCKAHKFGWDDYLLPIRHLHDISSINRPESLGNALLEILSQPMGCPFRNEPKTDIKPDMHRSHNSTARNSIRPCVLLPKFSPKRLGKTNEDKNSLFLERYMQLEDLLIAGSYLRKEKECKQKGKEAESNDFPALRLVCIDNLNIFGDEPLHREELSRIFDLFKKYDTIGVFTVEQEYYDKYRYMSVDGQNPIEYMADVVILLESDEDKGYFHRYFEITKSRHLHEIYGKHPYRIKAQVAEDLYDIPFWKFKQAFIVYPSLHYLTSASEQSEKDKLQESEEFQKDESQVSKQPAEAAEAGDGRESFFGIKGFERILPQRIGEKSIIAIEGPSGCYKSHLAKNYLVKGLLNGQNVLFIELQDRLYIDDKPILNKCFINKFNWSKSLENDENNPYVNKQNENFVKYIIKVWQHKNKNVKDKYNKYIQIAFKSGALIPEEFMDTIVQIVKSEEIERIVFSDISLIGISYPFLNKSKTADDLFLVSFAHLMRNHKTGMVFVGTIGNHEAANQIVNKACSLADAVISCSFCDIYGSRHVIVSGEGLIASNDYMGYDDSVPAVISLGNEYSEEFEVNNDYFTVDFDFLKGLVGFNTGRIYRPGITLYVYQESHLGENYNKKISELLNSAFPRLNNGNNDNKICTYDENVSIVPFFGDTSESIHDSFKIIRNMPLDRTVLYVLDEFFMTREIHDHLSTLADVISTKRIDEYVAPYKEIVELTGPGPVAVPYYNNVLLFAYRKDIFDELCDINESSNTDAQLVKIIDELREDKNNTNKYYKISDWESIKCISKKLFDMADTMKEKLGNCEITQEFDYDDICSETFSCMLMDVLVASIDTEDYSKDDLHNKLNRLLTNDLCNPDKKVIDNIQIINYLLNKAYDKKKAFREKNSNNVHDYMYNLNPKAATYVCWYSQLCDLVNHHPELADKLDICALPGYGFTGDWFIGIIKGSVSYKLGIKVVDILCSKTEVYKRFFNGVGLPALESFYHNSKSEMNPNFFLMQGSTIPLNKAFEIHNKALQRSFIDPKNNKYKNYRSVLYRNCNRLATSGILDCESIKKLISRIPGQIEVINSEN